MDPVNEKTPQQNSPVGQQPTKAVHPSWVDLIKETIAHDEREQPWKKAFGTPKGTLDDEDWINYPAMFDMAKKGIKG